ncbi:DM13 domain-containing protein [Nostocales cyanobacterium LEGE 11386]|nr:DM13 domain-containing protein [Nostocales cyanobacterium LEGE 11386]
MKLNHLLILGLVSGLIVGCVREAVNMQFTTVSMNTDALSIMPSAQANTPPKSARSLSGTFVSGEHKTQGTVRITNQNGRLLLKLEESFKTSEMGPDLVIVLHRSNNVIGSTKPPAYPLKKGDYVVLTPLKKFRGAQTYTIPNNINLADYKSVAIWCRKFNATFGAASLRR